MSFDERLLEAQTLTKIWQTGIVCLTIALLGLFYSASTCVPTPTLSDAEHCAKACGPGRLHRWVARTHTPAGRANIPEACLCVGVLELELDGGSQ